MPRVIFLPLSYIRKALKTLALFTVLAVLASPLVSSRIPTTLEKIQGSGRLIVISRNGPTTYYKGPNGYTGFEYLIAKKFADYLGVELEIKETEDLGSMIDQVGSEFGDLAASGLTVTKKRKEKVLFGEPYLQITQEVIYRSDQEKPSSIEDLIGKSILVISNSSHSERLRELQREYPQLTWEERSDVEMLDLLEMVHSGKVDYAIVDSNAYEINSSLYPKAQVAFSITEPQDVAWAFKAQKDQSLVNEAQKFFNAIKQQGVIDEAMEKFYGHLGEIDYSGAILFAHRLDTRLPKWEEKLKAAASEFDLDWQLLAALSYQESHWNPKAKSPTGVRGFMMLTKDTAKFVGIKNRLDPDQSIRGGAKYFRSIYDRIPDRIEEPDRTWLALAAYNVGLGHLEDARKLTESTGGNPDKWSDVRETLPLLAKRKYYKNTKHGYARGWEPVDYVKNIRNFHTIIAWNEVEEERLQQLAMNETQKEFAQVSPAVTEAVKTLSTSSL
ncbi:membrane-bound lytic murein transglycosylase MltF [Teredinibacter sp. KSP-S5-2]|uniref:membrane-bound lytic murein transglycosylase MltF n=1 Tax=Teredinibacter sp. KSP-S5-2 TaxID=3034506 RepID=UPI002935255D|nr:membrane-bound lytic murein transglycosylase MltF [Teredinibacter sp. KSP-S5-2]WNO11582.1 membrane-bound lytic murein transglycosylase MltF [Teredinibacter sp. KSP-S5-2]